MSKILIISPSGNFYGRERVLFDYLGATGLEPEVAVPEGSLFGEKLHAAYPNLDLRRFTGRGLARFYAGIWGGLMMRQFEQVYINEGGHVKYLLLLARSFPRKKFTIHIRIKEDADANRWIMEPGENVTVVGISKNIQQALPVPSVLLYDAFP